MSGSSSKSYDRRMNSGDEERKRSVSRGERGASIRSGDSRQARSERSRSARSFDEKRASRSNSEPKQPVAPVEDKPISQTNEPKEHIAEPVQTNPEAGKPAE